MRSSYLAWSSKWFFFRFGEHVRFSVYFIICMWWMFKPMRACGCCSFFISAVVLAIAMAGSVLDTAMLRQSLDTLRDLCDDEVLEMLDESTETVPRSVLLVLESGTQVPLATVDLLASCIHNRFRLDALAQERVITIPVTMLAPHVRRRTCSR